MRLLNEMCEMCKKYQYYAECPYFNITKCVIIRKEQAKIEGEAKSTKDIAREIVYEKFLENTEMINHWAKIEIERIESVKKQKQIQIAKEFHKQLESLK